MEIMTACKECGYFPHRHNKPKYWKENQNPGYMQAVTGFRTDSYTQAPSPELMHYLVSIYKSHKHGLNKIASITQDEHLTIDFK